MYNLMCVIVCKLMFVCYGLMPEINVHSFIHFALLVLSYGLLQQLYLVFCNSGTISMRAIIVFPITLCSDLHQY